MTSPSSVAAIGGQPRDCGPAARRGRTGTLPPRGRSRGTRAGPYRWGDRRGPDHPRPRDRSTRPTRRRSDPVTGVDQYLDEVATEVGLDDFGHPSFRDGLDLMVANVGSARLNDVGAASFDAT